MALTWAREGVVVSSFVARSAGRTYAVADSGTLYVTEAGRLIERSPHPTPAAAQRRAAQLEKECRP